MGRILQGLEAVEDEQAAPLADDAGEALAFLERAGGAGGEGFVRVVTEEGEALLEEQVGGSGQLLARALAVERPRKGGVAAGHLLSDRPATHFATSDVFPSPPKATK